MNHDRENSPIKASEYPHSQGGHKEQKVLVVSLSNTVINPGTVVIKALRKRERERDIIWGGGGGGGRGEECEGKGPDRVGERYKDCMSWALG